MKKKISRRNNSQAVSLSGITLLLSALTVAILVGPIIISDVLSAWLLGSIVIAILLILLVTYVPIIIGILAMGVSLYNNPQNKKSKTYIKLSLIVYIAIMYAGFTGADYQILLFGIGLFGFVVSLFTLQTFKK